MWFVYPEGEGTVLPPHLTDAGLEERNDTSPQSSRDQTLTPLRVSPALKRGHHYTLSHGLQDGSPRLCHLTPTIVQCMICATIRASPGVQQTNDNKSSTHQGAAPGLSLGMCVRALPEPSSQHRPCFWQRDVLLPCPDLLPPTSIPETGEPQEQRFPAPPFTLSFLTCKRGPSNHPRGAPARR